jgi:hypothetical protein
MSLSEMNLDSVPDLQTIPDGEYQVQCKHADEKLSKAGNTYIQLLLEPVDHPDAEPIFENLTLPSDSDEPRTASFKARRLKSALEAFGLPTNVTPTQVVQQKDDFVGQSAWVFVKTNTDPEYGTRNEIKRYGRAKG